MRFSPGNAVSADSIDSTGTPSRVVGPHFEAPASPLTRSSLRRNGNETPDSSSEVLFPSALTEGQSHEHERVCLTRLRCVFRLSQPLDAFFPVHPCPDVSPGWHPRDSPFEGLIPGPGWSRLSTGPHPPAVTPTSPPVPARHDRKEDEDSASGLSPLTRIRSLRRDVAIHPARPILPWG